MTTTNDPINEHGELPRFAPRHTALWAVGVAWYLVVAWLFVQRGLVELLSDSPSLNYYLVQPVVWLGLAVISYVGWQRLPDRPPFLRILTAIAALLGALHVGFFVLGGVIAGFGDSYVAGQFANYPRNLWFIATWLVGLEMARAFLFHAWRRYHERLAFAGTTALLVLAMTPYGQLRALSDGESFLATVAGFLVPLVILNVLLTWLVEHGGPGPAIGYRFVLLSFEWFSQVQPDLDWPALFVIGAIAPIISARLIQSIYTQTEEGAVRWEEEDAEESEDVDLARAGVWSWTVTVGLVVSLLVAGLLGYRPAVVSGISMEPAYERGDLAIIKHDVDPATLAIGDVIEFQGRLGHSVIHRIVAIEDGPGGLVFTTKGDNNTQPDEPFSAELISGEVVFLVPALGWPAIWLRGG